MKKLHAVFVFSFVVFSFGAFAQTSKLQIVTPASAGGDVVIKPYRGAGQQGLVFNGTGDDGNYRPFLNNSEWFSVSKGFEGYINSAFITEKDTSIDGLTYSKINEISVPLKSVFNDRISSVKRKIGELFVREDVPNKKIYQYFKGTGDVLIYDFGLEIGGSLPKVPECLLTTIDSIEGPEGLRKRFIFKNVDGYEVIWVEGVGNISSPFIPQVNISDFQNLICSSQNGVSVYSFVNLDGISCDSFKDVLANINENLSPPFSIYPNPTKGVFRIVFNENISHRKTIRIVDINGKTISNVGEFEGLSYFDMDISKLPNGLYFCLINSDGNIASFRIIKQ
jgi:hypothetical protein